MDMENVMVTIKDAAVTAVREFRSFKGYGVDFYIEAMSGNSPLYFQVVFYDDIARSYCRNIHEGDHVKVTGSFRDKIYRKNDGTDGHSLLMERPKVFAKTAGGNSEQQLPQQDNQHEAQSSEDIIEAENAATAAAISAENVAENNENSQCITEKAETALQDPHAVTAEQQTAEQNEQKPQTETKRYPPLCFCTGSRLPTPEDEDELPF